METWIVVGAAVIAVAPRVPGLRNAAKVAVKGGMKAVDTGRDAAVTAGEHWADLVAEAKADSPSDEQTSTNGSSADVAVKVPVTADGDEPS
ncbi:MAG: DUF5132 domain-containing protein [Actinomycetota bacterium]